MKLHYKQFLCFLFIVIFIKLFETFIELSYLVKLPYIQKAFAKVIGNHQQDLEIGLLRKLNHSRCSIVFSFSHSLISYL